LADVEPDELNNYRPMTALKLVMLATGIDVFSKNAVPKFDHTYYLDLFAGSGATRIRQQNRAIAGSPILAPVVARKHFREYHYVEIDEDAANALESRLDVAANRFDFPRERCHVHTGKDANEWTHDFLDDLREEAPGYKGVNLFTFIDPEGLEPEWSVVNRIGDIYGDTLINFPEVGTSRKKDSGQATKFFGTDKHQHKRSETARRKFYEQRLRSCQNTDITIPTRIDSGRSGNRFHRQLIYATRETPGGSPWQDAIHSMGDKLETLDGDIISIASDMLIGDIGRLEDVLAEEDLHDEADGDQFGLGEFQ
jgi:three-Cys-motif partner protein